MITDSGKDILSKYLLGHTSSYASHIAVGCGERPLGLLDEVSENADSYKFKEELTFEMFRVPINSRGIVKENGTEYVVLTAEVPSVERYGITEIGVFSAGSNPESGTAGSKMLYTFSNLENWEHHTQTTSSQISDESSVNVADDIFPETDVPCFGINSDNPIFSYDTRVARQEAPRFLNNSIMLRGDTALINIDAEDNLIPDDTQSSHIHLTGASLNLDENSPTDELRLAFSIINRIGIDLEDETPPEVDNPEEVRIVLEFASGEGAGVQNTFMEIRLINDPLNGIDFSTNRYFVISKRLEELRNSIGFSWDSVTIVKAYAQVIDIEGLSSDKFYIAFDGLRLEDKTNVHPLYAMTGYSPVKNNDGVPIVKAQNSNSFVEFRFALTLDVDTVTES
jgi:hypothetical protein